MKLLATLCLASAILAAPAGGITDVDILQFALTLEHLENAFYNEGLNKLPSGDFLAAGFSQAYYNNLKYIAHDENSHVEFLTSALKTAGAEPVAACEYSFPYTDAKSFVTLSAVLEGVGSSAYLGAAGLISNKDYLSAAGSILVDEALHTSLQRYSLGQIAFPSPYGTGLGVNEVYSLAAAFIKSCPSTNYALPVKAFPTLEATQGLPTAPGITFTFKAPAGAAAGQFVTYISGLDTTSVPANLNNGMIETTVADTAMGQTYVVLTSANVTGQLTDNLVVAGPAILEITPPAPQF